MKSTKNIIIKSRRIVSLFAMISLSLSGCSLVTSDTIAGTKPVGSNSSQPSTMSGTAIMPGTVPKKGTTTESSTKTSPASADPRITKAEVIPDEKFKSILERLTLEEKIKQMLLVHYDAALSEKADGAEYGGYLFFGDFFKERKPDEVTNLLKTLTDRSNTPYPLLFAVDEEGGTVNRISRFKQYREKKFSAPQQIFKESKIEGLIQDTRDKSEFLKGLGINLNLAPVADLSTDPDSFIYDRTLGLPVAETAVGISAMVRAMKEENILSSLKHFPGYGDNVDTHQTIAVDGSSFQELEKRLEPFRAGIEAGADTLMVSHIIMKAFDKDLPASLSLKVHAYIRTELGFNGVIMTDDLQMKGLTDKTKDPFVTAVLAGNDLLITADPESAVGSITKAVREKKISEIQIDEAVLRVLKLKASLYR